MPAINRCYRLGMDIDSAAAIRAGRLFESMLLEQVLQPSFGAATPLGDYGAGTLARSIAETDAGGFAAALARSLGGGVR